MKIANLILITSELLLCIIFIFGDYFAFGNGQDDIVYYFLMVCSLVIHLVFTIILLIKRKSLKILTYIFSLTTLFFLLKASFFRGPDFPWDGDIIVNHGRLKPNKDNKITYKVKTNTDKYGQDSLVFENIDSYKYNSTLWGSDPECTECEDCVIDSGKVIIPDTLKKFMNPIYNGVLLLEGKSPYKIQGKPYAKYKIQGQVIGVNNGKLIFYVSYWSSL